MCLAKNMLLANKVNHFDISMAEIKNFFVKPNFDLKLNNNRLTISIVLVIS